MEIDDEATANELASETSGDIDFLIGSASVDVSYLHKMKKADRNSKLVVHVGASGGKRVSTTVDELINQFKAFPRGFSQSASNLASQPCASFRSFASWASYHPPRSLRYLNRLARYSWVVPAANRRSLWSRNSASSCRAVKSHATSASFNSLSDLSDASDFFIGQSVNISS